MSVRKIISYCIITFLVYALFSFINTPAANADPLNVVEFTSPGATTLSDNAFFDVKESGADIDCTEKGVGPISVTIKSIKPDTTVRDTITLQVIEINNPTPGLRTPTSNTCIFGNTFLYFSPDNQRFPIESTVTITQQDTSGGKATNGIVDTISVTVSSTSTPDGTPLTLTETGPNTGIFQGKIKFTAGSTVTNSALHVATGDIITTTYLGIPSYGQIQPSPNGSAGLLIADVGDTIKATYNGFSGTTLICVCGGPGGGGGGLIRPGLVLDALVAAIFGGSPHSFGGSPYIVLPPSFGGEDYHFSDGLILTQGTHKTPFDISKYNNEIPRQVMVTDKKVNMTFKTFEAYDPKAVIHMGLYFIPRGEDMLTTNSLASIIYEKNSPVEINDPNHILSNASGSSTSDDKFQYTQFSFVPTKSYDKMSFLARAWNDQMYSTDVRVHDEVDKPIAPRTLLAGVIVYDTFGDLEAALEKDGFYKPQIMAHIHGTTDVFSSTEGGHVHWLYDIVQHSVTLVITDKNDNELYSYRESLVPYVADKKVDYGFMQFTVQQLNRLDQKQEEHAMGIEAAKAMFSALEKRLIVQSNW